MLDNLKLSYKITGLSIATLLLVAIVFGLVAIHSLNKLNSQNQQQYDEWSDASAKSYKSMLENGHQTRLKDLVTSAGSFFEQLNQKVLNGEMSLMDAQEQARNRLATMRYDGGKGYFWINSIDQSHPIMIMHPTVPALNGKDVGQFEKNGRVVMAEGTQTPMFQEFVRVCNTSPTGDGFVRYPWPNPKNLDEWLPKLSYVQKYEPWGWVYGSGVYVDDIDKALAAQEADAQKQMLTMQQSSREQMQSTTMTMIITMLVLAGFGILTTTLLVRNIVKPIHRLKEAAIAIAEGDLTSDITLGRRDEIGELSSAFLQMTDNLKAKTRGAEQIA